MPPSWVGESPDVVEDIGAGFVSGAVNLPCRSFGFQRCEEALRRVPRRGLSPSLCFARMTFQCDGDGFEVFWAVQTLLRAFREVLAQEPVGVLVRAALPWAVRIAEVDWKVGKPGAVQRDHQNRPSPNGT